MPNKRRAESLDLSKIGKREVRNGILVWTPPKNIEPELQKIIEDSVRELNRRVANRDFRLSGKEK
jgi:hypothetical protein